jgi:hypothetical protein
MIYYWYSKKFKHHQNGCWRWSQKKLMTKESSAAHYAINKNIDGKPKHYCLSTQKIQESKKNIVKVFLNFLILL